VFSVRIWEVKEEDVEMSSSSESEFWLDQWWPALIIFLAVSFALILALWNPSI
jgi:hypothetical protein